MMILKKEKGFSLVELMIVVAIMAILAAIAIPSFLRFSMKSKTSEATGNLSAIRTAQESYKAENDVYLACAVTPAIMTGAGASTPRAWVTGTAFETTGFEPDGNVRYSYTVTAGSVNPIATAFAGSATGDLDEDGTSAVYTCDKDAGTYPKVVASGDDF